MRWLSPNEAQASAFSAPDAQTIAFRLPGHLAQDRVHILARAAFGYRAEVGRQDGTWVVSRRPFYSDRVRQELAKQRCRDQQRAVRRTSLNRRQLAALYGGL